MRFDFAFEQPFALPLLLVTGATSTNSWVEVDERRLRVRFGRLGVTTPVDNVRDVQVTRDYRWYRAIGARLSLADRGATYGSNTTGGVCVCFHEPVQALPMVTSPAVTVTVADLEGLAAAVREVAGLSSPDSPDGTPGQ